MHSKGIFHRDIKAGNVLVAQRPTLDTRGMFKLADLGLAGRSSTAQTLCGTPGTQHFSKGMPNCTAYYWHSIVRVHMKHACVQILCAFTCLSLLLYANWLCPLLLKRRDGT